MAKKRTQDPDVPNIEDILREYEKYEQQQKEVLINNAAAAHIAGDLKAQQALDIKLSFDLVNKEALKFLKKYKEEIMAGGTTIQGKFIPWLKDRSTEERKAIQEIIERGYKEGKATGVTQYKTAGKYGLYPNNTIAQELQAYFNTRKSHASMVARTEIARIQFTGSFNRYKKQGVKRGLWLVFEPCPICEKFNHQVYDIDKLPYEIPVHPHCRCALAPVPDDVPEGPAPNLKEPKGFEGALPYTPASEALETIHHAKGVINASSVRAREDWLDYSARMQAAGGIDDKMIDAIEDYVSGDYTNFNKWLYQENFVDEYVKEFVRHGGDPDEIRKNIQDRIKKEFEPQKEQLDKAIDKHRLQEDAVLYRGFGADQAEMLMKNGKMTAKNYTSTSRDFTSTMYFSGGKDGYQNIMVLSRKKGDKGLYINHYEQEVILPRDTEFKLVNIRTFDDINFNIDGRTLTRDDYGGRGATGKFRLLFVTAT